MYGDTSTFIPLRWCSVARLLKRQFRVIPSVFWVVTWCKLVTLVTDVLGQPVCFTFWGSAVQREFQVELRE